MNRGHFTFGGGRSAPLLLAPALALFALTYVVPLALMFWGSLYGGERFTISHYSELLTSPVFAIIVWRTLKLAGAVTFICLVLGYPMAYALTKLRSPFLGVAFVLVTAPYLTSVLIRSYAWIIVLGGNGMVNRLLVWMGWIDRPIKLVFNDIGTYVGMVQIQLPLMILPLYAALRQIDRMYSIAAQGLGSTPASAFWNVTLPLSLPGAAAGSILVFLSCIGFYVTPALLGGPGEYLVAQAIHVRVSLLADFSTAAAQASFLLVLVLVLAFVFRDAVGRALGASDNTEQKAATRDIHEDGIQAAPYWKTSIAAAIRPFLVAFGEVFSFVRRPVLWAILALGLAFLILPMLVVIPVAFSDASYLTFPPPGFSLRWFRAYFSNPRWLTATGFSLWISVLCALLALVVGGAAAFALNRRPIKGHRALHLMFVSPLIVPHMVIAVALFFLLAKMKLANHPISFVIAYTLLAIPYVMVIVSAGLKRFDSSLEAASASLGASQLTTLAKVTLPLLVPTMASAFGFAFLSAFDDLVVALFFSTPTATTLPMRMWDDIRDEISPMVAVVAVLCLSTVIAAYLLTSFFRIIFRSRRYSAPF